MNLINKLQCLKQVSDLKTAEVALVRLGQLEILLLELKLQLELLFVYHNASKAIGDKAGWFCQR